MSEIKIFETIRDAYLAQARFDARLSSQVNLSEETVLMGKTGILDSMSVVAFILELEDRFEVPLLDEVMGEAQKRASFNLGDLSSLIAGKCGR